MLDKHSDRWAELNHAHGTAIDTPEQLYELLESENYGNDPNDVLFGCLCHQGSIYTATYAAVPHVVRALPTQSTDGKIWLFAFLGRVAIARDAAPVPDDLQPAYLRALEDAKSAVLVLAQQTGTTNADYCHLLSSVPALHGLDTTHEIVDWMLTAHEVCGLCKSCGEEFSVVCETLPFKAQHVRQHPAMAPVRRAPHPHAIGISGTPHGPQIEVIPAARPHDAWDGSICAENALIWLTKLAGAADKPLIVERLLTLFGTLACPNCSHTVSLWEAAKNENVSR